MSDPYKNITELGLAYHRRLHVALEQTDWPAIEALGQDLFDCWANGKQLFLCGNGGSAGNAIHIANDFMYGVAKQFGSGINVNALAANNAVMTCLANDIGYENIFSHQLSVHASKGDILIVLSGSGNSENILNALEQAKKSGVKSYAILGYSGGKAKELADVPIHYDIDDMQISEDLQLIVGHMAMQWLYQNRDKVLK